MGKIRVTPYINNSKFSEGKWYMRVHYEPKIDMQELVRHIELDSKVENSIVEAVVLGIVKQMEELLYNGHPIRIPHFGLLKLGVNSEGVETVKEYNAGRHIKNLHITFRPDAEIKVALREIKFVKYVPIKKSQN